MAESTSNPPLTNPVAQLACTNMADQNDTQEKDIDELDDDFASDDENADPNVFRISNALTPPSAISYSARELHSELTAILDRPLSDVP